MQSSQRFGGLQSHVHSQRPAQRLCIAVEELVKSAIPHKLHHEQLLRSFIRVPNQVHQVPMLQFGQDFQLVVEGRHVLQASARHRRSFHRHSPPVGQSASVNARVASLAQKIGLGKRLRSFQQFRGFEHLHTHGFRGLRFAGIADHHGGAPCAVGEVPH
ncbi:hypothetical protein Mapa_009829 [Marchantia paleacea]|nr:hypothetical protein Mapa_009829 [Marchantia paleacea]